MARRWARWLGVGVGTVVLLVAAATGIGLLLPVGHTATVSVALPVPADSAWGVVRDFARYPEWWDGVTAVTLVDDAHGETWRQVLRDGTALTVRVTEPGPRTVVTRIVNEDLPFGGTWTYAVTGDSMEATVTVTEDGEVYNPFFRFMSRFVIGHEATLRGYGAALQAHAR